MQGTQAVDIFEISSAYNLGVRVMERSHFWLPTTHVVLT